MCVDCRCVTTQYDLDRLEIGGADQIKSMQTIRLVDTQSFFYYIRRSYSIFFSMNSLDTFKAAVNFG